MYRSVLAGAILAAAVTTMSAAGANAQQFQANFSGFQELGALNTETGAILSPGQATLALNLNQKVGALTYTLTYSGLTTTTQTVTQAHIHFGKVHVPGGIIVFLCAASGVSAPPGTAVCSNNAGTNTASGTITAANIIGPAAQNIPAGDFDGLVAALLSNTAYGNIHTTKFPAGEIRGQIHQLKDQQGENEDQQGQNQNQNQN
jgi:CHRD domain